MKARLNIVASFFDELATVCTHAQAASDRLQQTADIGVTCLSELRQLVEFERSLPSAAPPVDLLIRVLVASIARGRRWLPPRNGNCPPLRPPRRMVSSAPDAWAGCAVTFQSNRASEVSNGRRPGVVLR